MTPGRRASPPRRLTALPSVRARALAMVAIVVAGMSGSLIGWAFVGLQCAGSCEGPKSIGAIVGALTGAGGVAVVAVLALRAMSEWQQLRD
jgi:hypothetical protein